MSSGRVFMDVSYTRTQQASIGICRTVRRLFGAISQERAGACIAVAFNSGGFRRVQFAEPGSASPARRPPASQRLFDWLSAGPTRRLVGAALRMLPDAVLYQLWRCVSILTFNGLTRSAAPQHFERGDVLFLADASWKYPAWTAARQARTEGARVVLMVYDLMPIRHPEYCFALVPILFRHWLARMLASSDAVVCISQATKDDLLAWAREQGLAAASLPPVSHFRLGADLRSAGTGAPRRGLLAFLDAGEPCFATVGSFEPKKNFGLVLAVFERLWAQGFHGRLVMAGRPTPECEQLVRRLRASSQQGGRLLTLFDASDAEIDRIYARCRALVFPSLMEGFGLPLVEARAQGCPVIASDLPVFHEVADEGVSFFDQTSADALAEAVRDHALKDRRALAGRQHLFPWQESARECLARIDEALAPSG